MSQFKKIIENYLANLADGTAPDANALDALLDAEEPKVYVPKETFIQVKKAADDERAEHKKALDGLQKQVDEGSEASEALKEAQAKVEKYEKDAAAAKADDAFKQTAEKLGVTNPRIIKLALQGNGVDLETIDPELLEVKINGLKDDKDLAGFFKGAGDDDEEDEEDDEKGGKNGSIPNGFKVNDNGLKGNKKTENDAITANIAAAFGLKQ